MRDAHSLYLETAAELGIVGLLLLGPARVRRRRRSARQRCGASESSWPAPWPESRSSRSMRRSTGTGSFRRWRCRRSSSPASCCAGPALRRRAVERVELAARAPQRRTTPAGSDSASTDASPAHALKLSGSRSTASRSTRVGLLGVSLAEQHGARVDEARAAWTIGLDIGDGRIELGLRHAVAQRDEHRLDRVRAPVLRALQRDEDDGGADRCHNHEGADDRGRAHASRG